MPEIIAEPRVDVKFNVSVFARSSGFLAL